MHLLEADAPARPASLPTPTVERPAAPGRRIVCATCGHTITREEARLAIQDAHEHRFMNPAGLLFHIGCFAQAEGCLLLGEPSDDYPWFPGFTWRIALCAACTDHLGWHFQSREGSAFYGLRLDRLAPGGEGEPPAPT